jgi:hypothetical protein
MIKFFLNNYKFDNLKKDFSGEKVTREQYKNLDIMEKQLINKFKGSLFVVYHYMYWACRYPSEDSIFFVKTMFEKKTTKFVLEYPLHALRN